MIATRYVPAVAVLLLLALVPTVVHNYLGLEADDGRRAEDVETGLAGAREVPLDRPSTWTRPQFKSRDAFERQYVDGVGRTARLVVIRSYDAKTLYHHPENAIAYGVGYESAEVINLPELPDVPVHVLRQDRGDQAVALYVLHHDGAFVNDPYAFQFRLAWRQLVAARRPATLFFARGEGAGLDPLESSLPARLLVAAIEAFLAQPTALTSVAPPSPPEADSR